MNKIVLVHGIFNSGRVFRKMSKFLNNLGFQTFAPDLKPSSGSSGLDDLAEKLEKYVEDNIPAEEKFHLIGFSMGGLVCRYYIQRLDGMMRVNRFISLSTPHNGSLLAYLLFNNGAKQMRPGSDFLKDLNSDIDKLEQVDIVSIRTPFDLSIIPSKSSVISAGENFKVPVLLHPLVARDKRVFKIIENCLVSEKQ